MQQSKIVKRVGSAILMAANVEAVARQLLGERREGRVA
jgi:hypothetical protein